MTAPPVLVAGGGGAVGSLLVDALRADGRSVLVVDPSVEDSSGPRVRGDITAPTGPLTTALRAAGTVILAVPEPVAVAALPTLAPVLAPDTLLVETLSVKTPIAAAVHTHRPGRPAVGINPMFAPDLGWRARPVALIRHCDGPAVTAFATALTRWGAQVVETGADEHDRITAATQALTHATILAFGAALDRLDPPAAAAPTAPPPHTTLRALLARLTAGTAEVYHDIQAANPYAATARRALAEAVTELDLAVGAPAEFAAVLARGRRALGAGGPPARQLCAQLFAQLPPHPLPDGAPGAAAEDRSRP
ncbi:prephenate dehydrogenase/arogenate dehydrogenase family protein [Rhodococcus sp. CH91]|uniref:prephenate dehydrogenase/arogenate dehydrogenase family protein n=1 Tax=Rhodococcus sp. CH91 TaxID=2910256 RepID=UPI001F4A4F5C|nr:prephenate dehydrogenase/arogenate dehydrogenase family protein [Rhodococcus sp. CH91]